MKPHFLYLTVKSLLQPGFIYPISYSFAIEGNQIKKLMTKLDFSHHKLADPQFFAISPPFIQLLRSQTLATSLPPFSIFHIQTINKSSRPPVQNIVLKKSDHVNQLLSIFQTYLQESLKLFPQSVRPTRPNSRPSFLSTFPSTDPTPDTLILAHATCGQYQGLECPLFLFAIFICFNLFFCSGIWKNQRQRGLS